MLSVSGVEDRTVGPNSDDSLYGVTNRFMFVDGSTEALDYFEDPFRFPWKGTQPNDKGKDDDCVE